MELLAPLTLALSLSAGVAVGRTDVTSRVSPALPHHKSFVVEEDLWQRPDFSPATAVW